MRVRVGVEGWNRVIVAAYKAVGLLLLPALPLWLASLTFSHVSLLFSHSWIVPTVVSPVDRDVLRLQAQLTEQLAQRDRLVALRAELVASLDNDGRVIAAELGFQVSFHVTMAAERLDRDAARAALERLVRMDRRSNRGSLDANQAFERLSKQRLGQLHAAELIDDDDLIAANHELAELARGDLGLRQNAVELEGRLAQLRREVSAMGAVAVAGHGNPALTYDVLMARRKLDRSVLSLDRAAAEERALQASLREADASIARYDALAADIGGSPHLQAREELLVAFVPYANLGNVEVGADVLACRVGPMWCKRVGQVKQVLDGEVVRGHPSQREELRGRMVHIVLDEPVYAQETVLYAGEPSSDPSLAADSR